MSAFLMTALRSDMLRHARAAVGNEMYLRLSHTLERCSASRRLVKTNRFRVLHFARSLLGFPARHWNHSTNSTSVK